MNSQIDTTQSANASIQVKKRRAIMGCVIGISGIGKTSQLLTLPPDKTLFCDFEAGDFSVEGWPGAIFKPNSWQDCRDLVVLLGGVDPDQRHGQPYNEAHYLEACKLPLKALIDKCSIIFIDSITAVVRLCFKWCMLQSTDRSGKCDTRAAYGLLAEEMSLWIQHIRFRCKKHIWFTALLVGKEDEFGKRTYCLPMKGQSVPAEFFATLDVAVTMTDDVRNANNKLVYGFVCGRNEWKYPVKDRSGKLSPTEEPHLGKLMRKLLAPRVAAASGSAAGVGGEAAGGTAGVMANSAAQPDTASANGGSTAPTPTIISTTNQAHASAETMA